MANIYLTTAIPYVNGAPHIGHALGYCLADAYARYQRQKKNLVKFQAGTDEHGNKIFKKATELKLSPQEFTDQNSAVFRELISALGVEYTDFIRTTDVDHKRRCQDIWQKLNHHIYSGTYEGWYCEGCEAFVSDKDYQENGGICPDHQTPYERLSEKNYYLKISDFKDQIKTAIETDSMRILPEFRKKEVLNMLAGAEDVSISRPKEHLEWGIAVPGDESQVMYVWIDALTNYITILGYPETEISNFWPADVQFLGKDVLRFHTIIWPAILLGLGLPLPKTIHAHGHILSGGNKMSKTLGNVVEPFEVIDRHGSEAFRYFFLRHIDSFADSDFTWDKFEAAYSGELANDLGNLVQRLATLSSKQNLPGLDFTYTEDPQLTDLMTSLHLNRALDHIWQKVQDLNREIDEKKPWELKKSGQEKALKSLLADLNTKLLTIAYELEPFLPDTSKKITAIFTAEKILPPKTPLFPKD